MGFGQKIKQRLKKKLKDELAIFSALRRKVIATDVLLVDPGATQYRIASIKRKYIARRDLPPIELWPGANSSPATDSGGDSQSTAPSAPPTLFDGGAIWDFHATLTVTKQMIKEARKWSLFGAKVLIATSPGVSPVTRRGFQDLYEDTIQIKRIFLAECPVAAAASTDLPYGMAPPTMAGVIGATRCDFGAIVGPRVIPSNGGGGGWNQILLSCATIARLRTGAWPDRSDFEDRLWNFNGSNGADFTRDFAISEDELIATIDGEIDRMVSNLVRTFDCMPTTQQAEIRENGIVLAGGLAENRYIVARLSEKAGIRMVPAPHPRDAVIIGMVKLYESALEEGFRG